MYNYAIIFENDTSPLAAELSEALSNLGFANGITDTLDKELLASLNAYRAANSMPQFEFCEPAILRRLGIEADGDEVITLARAATILSDTEVGYFDVCREIVRESRESRTTVTEACARRDAIKKSQTHISEAAVRAALLALLNR